MYLYMKAHWNTHTTHKHTNPFDHNAHNTWAIIHFINIYTIIIEYNYLLNYGQYIRHIYPTIHTLVYWSVKIIHEYLKYAPPLLSFVYVLDMFVLTTLIIRCCVCVCVCAIRNTSSTTMAQKKHDIVGYEWGDYSAHQNEPIERYYTHSTHIIIIYFYVVCWSNKKKEKKGRKIKAKKKEKKKKWQGNEIAVLSFHV